MTKTVARRSSAGTRSSAEVEMRIRRFRLPPVESALVVGRRASIGSTAMFEAVQDMMPDEFTVLQVEHEVVEAILVRKRHLRLMSAERLTELILQHTHGLMDDNELLDVDLRIEVRVNTQLDL